MNEEQFPRLFGRRPEVLADAPGRVNLIGEHTDYNGGLVLPTAIPQKTRVRLAPRPDRLVRVSSANLEPGAISEYELGREVRRGGWLDYVEGITVVLRDQAEMRGFDALIESDVPVGSGLSSSAALEVSLMRALRQAFSLSLDDRSIALLARKAENEFVGAPVGVMDQMAASLGGDGIALFIDTRSFEFERIPMPAAAEVLVIDSGISHRHADGEYRTRRAECEEAARRLGVRDLRDLGRSDLPRIEALPEPLARRVRHVVTENERVLDAIAALRSRDLPRLGRLFVESHESLRRDFDISIPPIDRLVSLACGQPEVFGARMTGGGFGGSIVALARRGAARRAGEALIDEYGPEGHPAARVVVPPPSDGAARRSA